MNLWFKTAHSRVRARSVSIAIRRLIAERSPKTILYLFSILVALVLVSQIPALFVSAVTETLLPTAISDENTWVDATVESLSQNDLSFVETSGDTQLLSVAMENPTECDDEISKIRVYTTAYSSDSRATITLSAEGLSTGPSEVPSHVENVFSEHNLEISTTATGKTLTCEDLNGLTITIDPNITVSPEDENAEDLPESYTWRINSIQVDIERVVGTEELNQRSYRWQYTHDSVEDNITADTPLINTDIGEQVALRVMLDNSGKADAVNQQFVLEYTQQQDGLCENATGWKEVTETTPISYTKITDASITTTRTNTSTQCGLLGCDGFVEGTWATAETFLTLPSNYFTETGFTLDTVNAQYGTSYCLRVGVQRENEIILLTPDGSYGSYPVIEMRDPQTIITEKPLKTMKLPKIKGSKKSYYVTESPTFEIDYFDYTDMNDPYVTGTVTRSRIFEDGNFKITANVIDHSGRVTDITPEITLFPDGRLIVEIPPGSDFRPGKYTLSLDIEEEGYLSSTVEDDFTWGVLAINPNKSIYTKGDDASIGMTVLDAGGYTVCDATVNLTVTEPNGSTIPFSTNDNTITRSASCAPNNVTDIPDYAATISKLNKIGTYTMTMTMTYNEITSTLTDTFAVEVKPAFDVERVGPVRIYPFEGNMYTMTLRVIPSDNYNGTVQEIVPTSFGISGKEFSQSTERTGKVLTWNVSWEAGRRYDLSYTFKAPEVSPEFYLLGPLTIGTFTELRQWHIAADASGDLLLLWDTSYGSVPSGWSSQSGGGGTYENKFIRGAATAGGTGGTDTHSHTYTPTIGSSSNTLKKGAGATDGSGMHSHTYTPTDATGSNHPQNRTLVIIRYTGEPSTLAANIIALFDATPDANWTRYSAQDTYFIKGSGTAGTTVSNSNQHTHNMAGTLTGNTGTAQKVGSTQAAAPFTHTHNVTGLSTNAVTMQPPYRETLLYRNSSGGDISIPTGMIGIFDAAAPGGWTSISGGGGAYENTFIKPSSSYGTTGGGSGGHSHNDITGGLSGTLNETPQNYGNGFAANIDDDLHTHSVDITLFSTVTDTEVLPSYVDVVLAKKSASTITIQGSCKDYDQSTNCPDSQTVRVAVGTSLQTETDTTATGSWAITGVTAPGTGDVITVYLETVADANEAVAVTQYDGDGDISGLLLYEEHLTIGSADNQSLTNAELSTWDYSASGNNEDIFFDVDGSNILTVDATTQSSQEELYIVSGNTHAPEAQVNTHDIEIDGTLTGGSANIKVSGSWDNNSVFTAGSSTVTFTATSGTENIDSTGASTHLFNTVNLGETSGSATWNLGSTFDVDGVLTIDYGTLGQGTQNITLSNNLAINANGNFTSGAGTLTFDGSGTNTWTNAATIDDLGVVTIDGTTKTINLGSSVKATSVTVGADDVIGLGSSGYTLSLSGSGTGASRPFIVNNAAGLSEGTNSTVSYEGTTGVDVEDETYYHLTLAPSGGAGPTYTLNAGTYGMQNLTIGDGTNSVVVNADTNDPALPITGNFTLNNGATFTASAISGITLSGDLTLNNASTYNNSSSSGIFTFNKGGTATWTDNNATSQDIGNILIDGSFTQVDLASSVRATSIEIGTNDTLNLGSSGYTLTITGSGTGASRPFINGNTSGLLEGTNSTVVYTGTTDLDVEDETYWHLTLAPSGGAGPVYSLNTGSVGSQNFTVGNGTNTVTVNADTYDPSIDINGTFTLNNGATFTASATSSITIGGDMTLNATSTYNNSSSTGTLTFDGSGTNTLTDSNATKQDLGLIVINGSSKVINLGSSATCTKMTVETDDTLGLASSGYTLTVSGSGTGSSRPFVLKSGGTLNYGTDSTVYLSGTSAIEVQEGTYDNITLAPSGGAGPTYTLGTSSTKTITAIGTLHIGDGTNAVVIDSTTYTTNVTADAITFNTGASVTVNQAGTWTTSSSLDLTGVTLNSIGAVVLDGSGVSYTSGGAVIDNLTLSGTVTLNNETYTISDNLVLSGSITHGSSSIVLTVTDGSSTLVGGGNTINNLTVNRSASTGIVSLITSSLTVEGSLTVSDADTLSISSGITLTHIGPTFTITNGTISGDGILRFTPASVGPGTDGTISSVVRYDASSGSIGSTVIDARTYSNRVEIFSDNSAGAARSVTLDSLAYTLSGNTSHLYLINNSDTYTLTLDASANPTVTIGGDLDFTGTGSSSEIITSGSGTWTVGEDVDFTGGTYTASSGNTFKMTHSTATVVDAYITSAGNTLQNFEVAEASAYDIKNADALDVNGTFTVSSGSFEQGAFNINVAGDFTLASGTTWIQPGTCDPTCDATITFDGDLSYADNTSPQQSIGDVIIGLSPDTTILTTDMAANSLTVTAADFYYTCEYDLDIGNGGVEISGTFDASASGSGNCSANEGDETTINTAEDFNINSGATFVQDASTVIFDDPSGTNTLITDGSYSLYNLTVNAGTGTIIQVQDPLDVDNDVIITQGNLDTVSGESNAISVGGSWDNNYDFTANSGTVTFDSADTGETIEAGNDPFNNVVFNNSGGGWTIQTDNLTAEDFTITDTAASGFTVNSVTVEVQGTYSCADAEFSNTTWTTATLYLNSATAYTVGSKTQNAETYSTLQIGANTDIRTWESNASVATTVDASGSLYSQDHANTSGDLYIWGDYHTQTNDYWSYATDFDGTDISGTPRQVDVAIDPAAKVTVDASDTLAAIGTSGNVTAVTRQGASNGYELSCLSSGTINFQYTSFDYLDGALGIDIQAGCTVTSLNYTDFDNLIGTVGTADAFITVASTVIGSGTKTITGVNFDNTGTGAEFNVNRTGGDDTGYWDFDAHTGTFDGEAYDGDDGVNEADPGMLRWDDSTTNSPPNSPTTLAQKKTDDTVIVVADWTSETSVKFTAQASDPDNPDTLYLCIEADQLGTAFSDTEDSCGSGVAYSGSPVEVTHTLTGLTQGWEYHWQARIKDSAAAYSSWVSYESNAEDDRDFGIDNTAPGTGTVSDGSTIIDTDLDVNTGSLTIHEGNWSGIADAQSGIKGYEYGIGTTAGGTDILTWTSKTEPGNLFSNGFESGDLSGWDANSPDGGDLAADEDAAYLVLYGAAATINDVNALTVQDNFTATGTYYARFYLNPNSLSMTSGDTFTLMDVRSSTTIRASVEMYYNGANHQVRGVLETGPQTTSWVTVGSTSWTSIELYWFADASGYVSLWVDGTKYDTATGNTNGLTVDNVLLGMVSDRDAGTSGTFYFDQFTSDNTDYNGPFTYFTHTVTTAGHMHTGQDYFTTVRATNNAETTGGTTNSDGIAVLPTFSFTVDSSSIDFLNLNEGNSWTDTKTTTTTASTNAYNGYISTIWISQNLTNTLYGSKTISNYPDPNSAPTTWSGTGFGYTTNDSDLSGGTADRFTNGGPKYAGFLTTGEGDPVADHTALIHGQVGAVSNEQFTITYRVTVDGSQAAGPYSTEIIYVATPTF